jgi:hypothetical protein
MRLFDVSHQNNILNLGRIMLINMSVNEELFRVIAT